MPPLLQFIITVVCCIGLSVSVIYGAPLFYYIGFGFVVAVSTLFVAHKPKDFLVYLLLFRAAIDPVLINVRFSVMHVDLGFGGSLSLLLIVGAGISLIAHPNARRVYRPVSYAWAIFCLINVAAILFSFDRGAAIKANIRYFSVFSVFILSMVVIETEKDAADILKAVLGSGLLAVFFGLVYYVLKHPGNGRFEATLGHPNILSFYLLVLLGMLFSGVGWGAGKWQQKALFVVYFLAIIFTKTRSGWLAFVIMMFFYSVFYNRKLLVPGILLVVTVSFMPLVREHVDNAFLVTSTGIHVNDNSALGWRLEKWSYLWEAFLKKPFTGHGISSAGEFGNDKLAAHNDYLRYLLETGIFGMFFAFMPYILMLHKASRDAAKKVSEMKKRLAVFATIFIPAFLIMSFSENLAAYIVIHWYLWAVFGVYFALDSIGKQRSGRS